MRSIPIESMEEQAKTSNSYWEKCFSFAHITICNISINRSLTYGGSFLIGYAESRTCQQHLV